jgi:hypothetical protein
MRRQDKLQNHYQREILRKHEYLVEDEHGWAGQRGRHPEIRWKTTTHSPNLSDSPRKFSNKQFEFDHGPNSRTFWLASSNETASCVSIQDERPYFQ